MPKDVKHGHKNMSLGLSLKPKEKCLSLTLCGRLDIAATHEFERARRLAKQLRCDCLFDLTEVESVMDSGYALLLLFRQSLAPRRRLRMIVCSSAIRHRLHSLGFELADDAIFGP